jgi:hypothetical protein
MCIPAMCLWSNSCLHALCPKFLPAVLVVVALFYVIPVGAVQSLLQVGQCLSRASWWPCLLAY